MKWIMITAALLGSTLTNAAGTSEKKNYKKHFENPVVDERIAFTTCAVSGAVYGMLTGEPGDVLCWGPLKGDTDKEAKDYYAYKAANRSTLDYYVETDQKLVGGFSDDSAGVSDSTVTLRTLTRSLEKPAKPRQSTLKFHTEWMYSEGGTMMRGKLPGKTVQFEAPVFSLENVDREMEELASELGN